MITKAFFLIPICLQPDGVNPGYFKLYIHNWQNMNNTLKCQRSTTSGCNDIGIKKLVFVIIAQLLSKESLSKNVNSVTDYSVTDYSVTPTFIIM